MVGKMVGGKEGNWWVWWVPGHPVLCSQIAAGVGEVGAMSGLVGRDWQQIRLRSAALQDTDTGAARPTHQCPLHPTPPRPNQCPPSSSERTAVRWRKNDSPPSSMPWQAAGTTEVWARGGTRFAGTPTVGQNTSLAGLPGLAAFARLSSGKGQGTHSTQTL